jgi:hypothetical protein
MARIKDAGIDVALTVFRSLNSEGANATASNLGQGLNMLYTEGRRYPLVCMYDDVLKLSDTDNALSDAFADTVIAFFSNIHPRFWFRINGHPVVGLYGTRYLVSPAHALGDSIRRAQERIRSELNTEVVFYGTETHAGRGIPVEVYHRWGAAATKSGLTKVSGVSHYATSVGPGYDIHGANKNSRRTGSKYNTARYDSAWRQAISLRNRIIAVETWNEYIESTSIAPTLEYGSMYVSVTKTRSAAFKRSLR